MIAETLNIRSIVAKTHLSQFTLFFQTTNVPFLPVQGGVVERAQCDFFLPFFYCGASLKFHIILQKTSEEHCTQYPKHICCANVVALDCDAGHLHSILALTTTCSDKNMYACSTLICQNLFFVAYITVRCCLHIQFISENVSVILINVHHFLDQSS